MKLLRSVLCSLGPSMACHPLEPSMAIGTFYGLPPTWTFYGHWGLLWLAAHKRNTFYSNAMEAGFSRRLASKQAWYIGATTWSSSTKALLFQAPRKLSLLQACIQPNLRKTPSSQKILVFQWIPKSHQPKVQSVGSSATQCIYVAMSTAGKLCCQWCLRLWFQTWEAACQKILNLQEKQAQSKQALARTHEAQTACARPQPRFPSRKTAQSL